MPFEIVVVDDCSRDETMLAGFAFGRASGWSAARSMADSSAPATAASMRRAANMSLFLNNDTIVKQGWLDELYETMQPDPQIGIAGAKLLYPGRQPAGMRRHHLAARRRLELGPRPGGGRSALLLPARRRLRVGRGADDQGRAVRQARQFRRALRAGLLRRHRSLLPGPRSPATAWSCSPPSEVVHFEGASAGTSTTGSGMKRFQAINHRKFFERWKETLASHRFNGELPELEAERTCRKARPVHRRFGAGARQGRRIERRACSTCCRCSGSATRSPSSRPITWRGSIPIPRPAAARHRVPVSPVLCLGRRRVPQASRPFDLVYLHRYSNASKYGRHGARSISRGRACLYNVADLHFLRLERQAELEGDPPLRAKAEQLRRLELGAMSFVDCVIVHSAAEAELLRRLAPQYRGARDPVDRGAARVDGKRGGRRRRSRRWPLSAATAIRPMSTRRNGRCKNIMPRLRPQVPGIELLLVGSHMPAEVSSLAAKDWCRSAMCRRSTACSSGCG